MKAFFVERVLAVFRKKAGQVDEYEEWLEDMEWRLRLVC